MDISIDLRKCLTAHNHPHGGAQSHDLVIKITTDTLKSLENNPFPERALSLSIITVAMTRQGLLDICATISTKVFVFSRKCDCFLFPFATSNAFVALVAKTTGPLFRGSVSVLIASAIAAFSLSAQVAATTKYPQSYERLNTSKGSNS